VVRAVRLTPVLAPTASTWLAIWSPVAPAAIEIVLLPRLPASVRLCASTLLAGAVARDRGAASMSPLLAMVLAPMLVARELAMLQLRDFGLQRGALGAGLAAVGRLHRQFAHALQACSPVSASAPSAVCDSEMPSLALRTAWFRPRICEVKRLLMASPRRRPWRC
jgi:hypothetical protein